MKIQVDKITEEGIEVREQIEPERFSLDMDSPIVNFIQPVNVTVFVKRLGLEIFADINLDAPCEYTCARCLAKFQDVLKKKFKLNYELKNSDVLELDEDIRQELILDCPMKVVCKPECKGLCAACGQNLNVAACKCV